MGRPMPRFWWMRLSGDPSPVLRPSDTSLTYNLPLSFLLNTATGQGTTRQGGGVDGVRLVFTVKSGSVWDKQVLALTLAACWRPGAENGVRADAARGATGRCGVGLLRRQMATPHGHADAWGPHGRWAGGGNTGAPGKRQGGRRHDSATQRREPTGTNNNSSQDLKISRCPWPYQRAPGHSWAQSPLPAGAAQAQNAPRQSQRART